MDSKPGGELRADTLVKSVDLGDAAGRKIEPFVSAEKAAEFLSLRPRRVLQLAREGALPAYPLGSGPRRVWRFRLSELASAVAQSALRSHVPDGEI